jgi:hypothetical protein
MGKKNLLPCFFITDRLIKKTMQNNSAVRHTHREQQHWQQLLALATVALKTMHIFAM